MSTIKHLRNDAIRDDFIGLGSLPHQYAHPSCGNQDFDAWVEPDFNDVTCLDCLKVLIGYLHGANAFLPKPIKLYSKVLGRKI